MHVALTKARLVASLSLIALVAGTAADRALAEERIALTAVSGYAPTVTWTREFQDWFIPEVNRRLAEAGAYAIDWNQAYSGQIARPGGELAAIQNGLADIGIVVIPFHTDVIPLYAINFYTPFVTADVNLASDAVDALAARFPAFAAQWEDLNQVPLTTFGVVDSYGVVVNRPVRTLADFAGLRIGGSGANRRWVEGIGATGVSANLADAYNDIRSGVMDGMVIHAGGALNSRLYEVAPYFVDGNLGAVASFLVTVNRDSWDRLPETVRTVLSEVAVAYGDHTGLAGRADNEAGLARIAESGGEVIRISAEDRATWAQSVPDLGGQWVADMEALGYPGGEIMAAYMTMMREAGQAIDRQWDRD